MIQYEVIKPANQEELTKAMRDRMLAGKALELLVLEANVDELAVRRGEPVQTQRQFEFLVDVIVDLYGLPYLTGHATEGPVDGVNSSIESHYARLEVNGTKDMKEKERTLSLYVS